MVVTQGALANRDLSQLVEPALAGLADLHQAGGCQPAAPRPGRAPTRCTELTRPPTAVGLVGSLVCRKYTWARLTAARAVPTGHVKCRTVVPLVVTIGVCSVAPGGPEGPASCTSTIAA